MPAELDFDLTLPEDRPHDSQGNRMTPRERYWPTSSGPSTPEAEKIDEQRGRTWQERLPDILRFLGTGVLLVTMYSFLVDGWRSGNDSLRYVMMMSHTGVLALIGLASLRWLHETKGARLLLSLALVSVPANFAILGALIFSGMTGVDPATYPDYVAWQAPSLLSAGLLSLAATLFLAPLSWLGFRVLARPMAGKLSCLFLFNNLLLLAPLRDSEIVAWAVVVMLVASVWLHRVISRGQLAARTREGMLAMMLPFLPLAILMGRSLWLYSMDFFLMAALSLTIYFFLRQVIGALEQGSSVRKVLEVLSILPALGVMPPVIALVVDSFPWLDELALPLAGLACAALIHDLASRSNTSSGYRMLAATIVLLSQGTNLLIQDALLSALFAAISGVALVIAGGHYRQRGLLFTGVLLVVLGISHQLYAMVMHFDLGSWFGLATLGIMAIVLASVLESKGGKLAGLLKYRWQELSQWEV